MAQPHCGVCKMDFSKPSNLRAHVKRKHPDKLDILAPITRNQSGSGRYICGECNKSFVSFSNLRSHAKQTHSDKLEELAPLEKKIYSCNKCNLEFNILMALLKHKSSHNIVKTVKCSLCQYTGASKDILIQHYTLDHCIKIGNETLEFDSLGAFQVWKSKLESETFASFVQKCGATKTLRHTKIMYICHRSGSVKTKGNNIQKLKTQGSNKIGGYCPAKMAVFVKNWKCVVQFCKSHIGHGQETDLEYLSLTKVQRDDIAAKIAAKIPLQVILDDIRSSVANRNLEHIHLLTKKDLYNIRASLNLEDTSVHLSTSWPVTDDVQSKG